MRQILKDNNITNLNQINDLIKEMVKDVLQEVLEAEMDDHLGYERNTLSFVSYKDRKEFAGDLKKVYSSGR